MHEHEGWVSHVGFLVYGIVIFDMKKKHLTKLF